MIALGPFRNTVAELLAFLKERTAEGRGRLCGRVENAEPQEVLQRDRTLDRRTVDRKGQGSQGS